MFQCIVSGFLPISSPCLIEQKCLEDREMERVVALFFFVLLSSQSSREKNKVPNGTVETSDSDAEVHVAFADVDVVRSLLTSC